MGIYDREYYQDDQPPGIRFGSGQMTVTSKLVILNVAIWIVDRVFMDGRLTDIFKLDTYIFEQPQHFYQLLTSGFLHADSPWHIIGNMFMLWMFGRDVERIYGRRDYLITYLTIIVMANLVWLGASFATGDIPASVVGASGGVSGIFALFVIHYPKRTLLIWGIIPCPAWVIGGIILVMNALGAANFEPGGKSNVAFSAHLGGILFGYIYYKTRWNFGRLIPAGLVKSIGKPRLKIADPDQYEREMDEKIDKLLEKISKSGMDSLTTKEKKILEDHSRRMQQKRR